MELFIVLNLTYLVSLQFTDKNPVPGHSARKEWKDGGNKYIFEGPNTCHWWG